jgi:uncharacterized protein (DUF427 family)
VTLTLLNAPFGSNPDSFNFERSGPAHVLYFEDSPRRVRVELAGVTVADSRRMKLLHETGNIVVYYFPKDDISSEHLVASDLTSECPFKGTASYWSLRVGDQLAENVVWGYDQPIEGAPNLAGYRALYWHKMGAWFEEDEQVFGHARDPYHRIDVVPSSRRVKIRVAGEVVAETTRPQILFESSLPTRYYIPEEDCRTDLFEKSDKKSVCPYKGNATYLSVRAGGELHADVIWTYREPLLAVSKIEGHLCFFDEKVSVELDGEVQEPPKTKWS